MASRRCREIESSWGREVEGGLVVRDLVVRVRREGRHCGCWGRVRRRREVRGRKDILMGYVPVV